MPRMPRTTRPVKAGAGRQRRSSPAAGPHKPHNPAPETPDEADRKRLAGEIMNWWMTTGGMIEDLYRIVEGLEYETRRPGSPMRELFRYTDMHDLRLEVSNLSSFWFGASPRVAARLPVEFPARPPQAG